MAVLERYREEMTRIIKRLHPQANNNEIRRAIEYSIRKRYKEHNCVLDNNYTKKQVKTTLLAMADYIDAKEPICTAYGVLFRKHGEVPNPLIDLIKSFMDGRDQYKKQMFKYLDAHDYDNVAKYNLFQLLAKRDANSIYGCLGNASSVLYNLYVAASIPAQGRSLISSATLFFEGFLANNVKFGSLEEILHYIDNVCGEKKDRHYDDRMMLDRNITVHECFYKIMKTCGDWRKGKIKWIPDDIDMGIVYDTIANLSQEDINRLYYKNNLYAFLDNKVPTKALLYILQLLEEPFLDPNHVPEIIKVELDTLQDILKEYVYYKHMYIDRVDRCNNMIKDVCAISDTDSTIVSFDAFYHYVLDKVVQSGQEFNIAKEPMPAFTMGEDIKPIKFEKKRLSYDFVDDKIIEIKQGLRPFEIIPQNNLKFAIINMIAYISGNLCNDYMVEYTKGNHSWQGEDVKCLLYLKNEFLFNRALLTMNKKNYATIRQLQEGVVIVQNQDKSMDIKGLPINKSTLNDSAKKELQSILYNYVLIPDKIDQVEIIKQLAILEKKIKESLERGEKEYYKPAAIKAIESYDDPMRIQGVKASLIWNMVRNPDLEAIDLTGRNTVGIVKVYITPTNIECIKDSHPYEYDKFKQVFNNTNIFPPKKSTKKEITALAIPVDVDTPDWVSEFIDYKSIINDSLKNFPVESVGIERFDRATINYSNILKI